ncbi:HAD-like domain-containing protein [Ustulina deusta]|nr:HAD-like domain-containing protein [Ustulina deusta]
MQVRLNFGWLRGFSHSSISRRAGGEYQDLLDRGRRESRKARAKKQAELEARAKKQAELEARAKEEVELAAQLTSQSQSQLQSNSQSEPQSQSQNTGGTPPNAASPAAAPYAYVGHYNPFHETRPRPFMQRTKTTLPPRRESRKAHQHSLVPPSQASGGVPDPTPEYLALASQPPFLLPQPRSLLVIVDLNGTLLHRPGRDPVHFVERPFARSFLSYIVNTFTVVIWSSARRENVGAMCRQLLSPKDHTKLVAIWDRNNFGLSKTDFDMRVLCYKRLTALWNDPVVAASHPDRGKWSQLNTVLVDDTTEKARSEPFNLVQVPEFSFEAKKADVVLPQVHEYLNQCSQQANVSAYIKGQPFQVDPGFSL